MAIFVDSGISQHCLFWNGEKNHITTYVSDYTKFQDIAYTVDAVVLYVSVAVELWDFHQGTSVQNDQTQHSQSRKHAKLVFISFFFYLFILSTIWQSWMSHQFYSKWTLMDEFIFFCKICKKCSFCFLY